jgi:hypothetical protein
MEILDTQEGKGTTEGARPVMRDLLGRFPDLNAVFPINDPIGAVVWGMDTGNVDSVFVAGKPMKRDGQLLHVDWNAVKRMVSESRDYVMTKSRYKLPEL